MSSCTIKIDSNTEYVNTRGVSATISPDEYNYIVDTDNTIIMFGKKTMDCTLFSNPKTPTTNYSKWQMRKNVQTLEEQRNAEQRNRRNPSAFVAVAPTKRENKYKKSISIQLNILFF